MQPYREIILPCTIDEFFYLASEYSFTEIANDGAEFESILLTRLGPSTPIATYINNEGNIKAYVFNTVICVRTAKDVSCYKWFIPACIYSIDRWYGGESDGVYCPYTIATAYIGNKENPLASDHEAAYSSAIGLVFEGTTTDKPGLHYYTYRDTITKEEFNRLAEKHVGFAESYTYEDFQVLYYNGAIACILTKTEKIVEDISAILAQQIQ